MKNDDLKTILERLQKPLRYASQDDFARLKNLADLESWQRSLVDPGYERPAAY